MTKVNSQKINLFPFSVTDELIGETIGIDILVLDNNATIADFLDALDDFAADFIADCRGCDGCCHERAPLLSADIAAMSALLPQSCFPAHDVCRSWGEITVDPSSGAVDITLRRAADGTCLSLDCAAHCCTVWSVRPFVCHSHFCLPRSTRLELLREDIVNTGENELTRLLLAEEANGAKPLTNRPLAEQINVTDYQPNGMTGRSDYKQILIRDCVSNALWRELTANN